MPGPRGRRPPPGGPRGGPGNGPGPGARGGGGGMACLPRPRPGCFAGRFFWYSSTWREALRPQVLSVRAWWMWKLRWPNTTGMAAPPAGQAHTDPGSNPDTHMWLVVRWRHCGTMTMCSQTVLITTVQAHRHSACQVLPCYPASAHVSRRQFHRTPCYFLERAGRLISNAGGTLKQAQVFLKQVRFRQEPPTPTSTHLHLLPVTQHQ